MASASASSASASASSGSSAFFDFISDWNNSQADSHAESKAVARSSANYLQVNGETVVLIEYPGNFPRRYIAWHASCIGEGGYGTVYEAYRLNKEGKIVQAPKSEKRFVIKIQSVDLQRPDVIQLQQKVFASFNGGEAEVIQRYPSMFSVMPHLGESFLIEGVSDCSTFTFLSRLELIVRLLAEFNFIHNTKIKHNGKQGFVFHGDVKPENLLIRKTEQGEIFDLLAIDFAVEELLPWRNSSKEVDRPTGNLCFLAPDFIRGNKTDIYSIAGMIAFLLGAFSPDSLKSYRFNSKCDDFIGEYSIFSEARYNRFTSAEHKIWYLNEYISLIRDRKKSISSLDVAEEIPDVTDISNPKLVRGYINYIQENQLLFSISANKLSMRDIQRYLYLAQVNSQITENGERNFLLEVLKVAAETSYDFEYLLSGAVFSSVSPVMQASIRRFLDHMCATKYHDRPDIETALRFFMVAYNLSCYSAENRQDPHYDYLFFELEYTSYNKSRINFSDALSREVLGKVYKQHGYEATLSVFNSLAEKREDKDHYDYLLFCFDYTSQTGKTLQTENNDVRKRLVGRVYRNKGYEAAWKAFSEPSCFLDEAIKFLNNERSGEEKETGSARALSELSGPPSCQPSASASASSSNVVPSAVMRTSTCSSSETSQVPASYNLFDGIAADSVGSIVLLKHAKKLNTSALARLLVNSKNDNLFKAIFFTGDGFSALLKSGWQWLSSFFTGEIFYPEVRERILADPIACAIIKIGKPGQLADLQNLYPNQFAKEIVSAAALIPTVFNKGNGVVPVIDSPLRLQSHRRPRQRGGPKIVTDNKLAFPFSLICS